MNENSILQDLDLDTFVTLNDIYLGQDFLGVNEQGLNIYRTHVSCVLDINNLSKYRTLRQKFKTIFDNYSLNFFDDKCSYKVYIKKFRIHIHQEYTKLHVSINMTNAHKEFDYADVFDMLGRVPAKIAYEEPQSEYVDDLEDYIEKLTFKVNE
mgnify:CR=1 FL=1